ncbi:MAG: hypothetical protein AB1486_32795 [Planctomycetota bacterium]
MGSNAALLANLSAIVSLLVSSSSILLAQATLGAERPQRGEVTHSAPDPAHGLLSRLPLAFIENRGQIDERARFYARRGGMKAYFTEKGFALQLVSRPPDHASTGPMASPLSDREVLPDGEPTTGANLFLTFEGASPGVTIEGLEQLPGRYNYFLGNDPSRWRTEVPAYRSIRYHRLYPGVDVIVRTEQDQLEYDLVLEPRTDLAQIIVRCEGASDLFIDEGGTLVIDTAAGRLEQRKPRTNEISSPGELVPIECSYRVLDPQRVCFDVPARNPERQLVIDPGLVSSTFFGGTGHDSGSSLAVDVSGAAYITGQTDSADLPTTPGAFDPTYYGGYSDAFVAKLSSDGSSLVYSTFLGGTSEDYGVGIREDGAGAALVAGNTRSSGFPTTPGAYDTIYDFYDLFVTKLDLCPAASASNYGSGWAGTLGIPA